MATVSTRRKTVKIKADMKEIKQRQRVEINSTVKASKINKIGKLLSRLIRKKREDIDNIRNEIAVITTDNKRPS